MNIQKRMMMVNRQELPVPMLDILKSSMFIMRVVVTRYFGGIKLGGGGLIRAYSGAVRRRHL